MARTTMLVTVRPRAFQRMRDTCNNRRNVLAIAARAVYVVLLSFFSQGRFGNMLCPRTNTQKRHDIYESQGFLLLQQE
jgi:hypothetical protein